MVSGIVGAAEVQAQAQGIVSVATTKQRTGDAIRSAEAQALRWAMQYSQLTDAEKQTVFTRFAQVLALTLGGRLLVRARLRSQAAVGVAGVERLG